MIPVIFKISSREQFPDLQKVAEFKKHSK